MHKNALLDTYISQCIHTTIHQYIVQRMCDISHNMQQLDVWTKRKYHCQNVFWIFYVIYLSYFYFLIRHWHIAHSSKTPHLETNLWPTYPCAVFPSCIARSWRTQLINFCIHCTSCLDLVHFFGWLKGKHWHFVLLKIST